jgi:hypothetical protein
MTLRCYVYLENKGTWAAECIDLDLMTKGQTPEIVVRGLRDAMTGYLKTATEDDPAGLIPRPSPLLHRLRYHLFCLRAAFTTGRHSFRLMDCSPDQFAVCV